MKSTLPSVLLLGDARLRQMSEEVIDFADRTLVSEVKTLHAVLDRFRSEYGFGRAIAAPQIGILKRIIALNIEGKRSTLINPVINWLSEDMFSVWDDCFSFPDLLVQVNRHSSISLDFVNESGASSSWSKLSPSTSELLQHEIDHLNGILAIDRAIDRQSIVYRRTRINSLPN
jgi:peptide deformylase